MTPEPPPRPARRIRPDPAFRRRALGVPADGAQSAAADSSPGSPAGPAAAAPVGRESFRSALARIPDLDRTDPRATQAVPHAADPGGRPATPERAARPAGPSPTAAGAVGSSTTDEPARPARALRAAALGSAAATAAPAATAATAAPVAATAAPDAGGVGTSVAAPVAVDAPPAAGPVPATPTATPTPTSEPEPELVLARVPVPAPATSVASASAPPDTGTEAVPAVIAPAAFTTGGRPTVPWWRRVGFAVVLLGLVAAIPLLGRTGYRLVTSSTDGKAANGGAEPGEPNFEELVTSTPTAVVIQKDAQGVLVNLTFLSLAGDAGGSVIFVPLDTKIPKPAFGVDRIRTSYTMIPDAPVEKANAQVAHQVASVLNVGIDEIIELDAPGWDRLVAPVGPLSFDNSDPLVLDGTELPTGPVQLDAALVAPYLASARDGEDDTSRFFRQEQLWRSWLAAVAASPKPDAVPGETTTGIGRFARQLAKGDVTYNMLPGRFVPYATETRFEPDQNAIDTLIADAVPAPDAAYPGSRIGVRILNGVAPEPIPTSITSKVVGFKGTVTVVGNGPSFGRAKTDVIYGDDTQKAYAELLRAGLGATGELRLDPAAPDNVGVTIILGKDLLGDGQPTATTSTAVSGSPGTSSSSTTSPPGGP